MQKVYEGLPGGVQEALLSVYGMATRRRFRQSLQLLGEAQQVWRLPRERQRGWVGEKLRRMLLWAVRTVPFYMHMERLARDLEGCPVDDVFGILQEFPIIEKEQVRSDPDAFMSQQYRGKARWSHTSGTTGKPLAVLISEKAWRVSDALAWGRTIRAGYRWGDWIARLVGDRVISLREVAPSKPYRVSWTDRRLYLSTYHLGRRTVRAMWSSLQKVEGGFVMGYPSALHALARLVVDEIGDESIALKGVLYSSEPFYPHQLKVVKKVFAGPVWGYYGMAERTISASMCAEGYYHLHLVDGYLEGQFGESDELGGGVTTSLVNEAMPLIRYRVGDAVKTVPTSCGCGWRTPVVEGLITKQEDSLVTRSGRVISPSILTWAFKDLAGIKAAQIEQLSESVVVVRVKCDGELGSTRSRLVERLREMTFGEFEIKVVCVDEIVVQQGGKTRFVINSAGKGG